MKDADDKYMKMREDGDNNVRRWYKMKIIWNEDLGRGLKMYDDMKKKRSVWKNEDDKGWGW